MGKDWCSEDGWEMNFPGVGKEREKPQWNQCGEVGFPRFCWHLCAKKAIKLGEGWRERLSTSGTIVKRGYLNVGAPNFLPAN